MTEIAVRPHTVERTVPGYWNHWTGEWVPALTFDDPREGFVAESPDGLRSWGRTKEAAIEMIERMRRTKASDTEENDDG